MIDYLDVTRVRELCPTLMPGPELDPDEVFEIVLGRLRDDGTVAFKLEWDSGGPGGGAGTETIYLYGGAFFTVSVDLGIKGPFESIAVALSNTVPVTREGQVMVTLSTQEIDWPGLDLLTLIGRLDFSEAGSEGSLSINGVEFGVSDLKAIVSLSASPGQVAGAVLLALGSTEKSVRHTAHGILWRTAHARFPHEEHLASFSPVLRQAWSELRAAGISPVAGLVNAFTTEEAMLVMESIAVALGTDDSGVRELLKFLETDDFVLRHKAAVGLTALDSTGEWALPEIIRTLEHADEPLVDRNLILALGHIGGLRAIRVLNRLYLQERKAPRPDVELLHCLERALVQVLVDQTA